MNKFKWLSPSIGLAMLFVAGVGCKRMQQAALVREEEPSAAAPTDPCSDFAPLEKPNFVRSPATAAPSGALRVGLLSWQSVGPGAEIEGKPATPRAVLEKNAANLTCLIRRAVREGAKLVVTPELALVGYGEKEFATPTEARAFAISRDDPLLATFGKLAAELKAYVVVCFVENVDKSDAVYNAAAVYDPDGKRVAVHRKQSLFDSEIRVFTPSDQQRSATTFGIAGFGNVGVVICADSYSDNVRTTLKEASKLAAITVSSAWTGERDSAKRPTEESRGRYDYERLSKAVGGAIPVLAANHVEPLVDGLKEPPAMNDVGLFGTATPTIYQDNEAFLAIVDVPAPM